MTLIVEDEAAAVVSTSVSNAAAVRSRISQARIVGQNKSNKMLWYLLLVACFLNAAHPYNYNTIHSQRIDALIYSAMLSQASAVRKTSPLRPTIDGDIIYILLQDAG